MTKQNLFVFGNLDGLDLFQEGILCTKISFDALTASLAGHILWIVPFLTVVLS